MHNLLTFVPKIVSLAAGAALFSAGCGSATDDRSPTWSFVSATITEPSCATVNCHSAFTQRAGLNLSARDVGFYTLVNGFYVIPHDSADSSLTYVLNASGSLRMPPDNPLPIVDIQLIDKWIDAGATND